MTAHELVSSTSPRREPHAAGEPSNCSLMNYLRRYDCLTTAANAGDAVLLATGAGATGAGVAVVLGLLAATAGATAAVSVLVPPAAAAARAACCAAPAARKLPVTVLTADTYGTARQALRGLPISVQAIETGTDKREFVSRHAGTVAVGNGSNDVAMIGAASLSIAVIGPEGAASTVMTAADVVVCNINDALDLLLRPKRITATMRR